MLLSRTMNAGKADDTLIGIIRNKLSSGKKFPAQEPDNQAEPISELSPAMPEPTDQPKPSFADTIRNLPLVKKISSLTVPSGKKRDPGQFQPPDSNEKKRKLIAGVRPFLRTLIPFAIPAAILLLIAFLATIPPFHAILGPASPALAGLFASGLSGIVTAAGLIFALIFAKRGGAFRAKNRRTGYAAVAAGFCLLCIAGIICSSAAVGLFKTGEETAGQTGGDRSAKLAAMLASGELSDEQGSSVSVQTVAPTIQIPSGAPTRVAPGSATSPAVPLKDALSVGESYWFGDPEHTCRATVYDYKVLPFYFWWFIDYNRFVQQVPPAGYSYLVVFLRIEDMGTKSALIPSSDQIVVTNNGNRYANDPFLDLSVFSQWQINYYSNNLDLIPYQWIREIGQDKRDYAFLMGYNIFAGGNGELTSNLSESTGYLSAFNETQPQYGLSYFLHPGTSNAIDGYLIYTVPTTAVNTTEDLKSTYVQITFNNLSYTRWQLGTDGPASGLFSGANQ